MTVHLLSLHPGTTLHDERGLLTVRHRWGATTTGPYTPQLAAALRTLADGPTSLDGLAERIRSAARAETPAEPQLALLRHAVDRLGHTLLRHITADAQVLATAVPLAPEATFGREPAPDAPVVLARAAHLRPVGDSLALESPRSRFRVRIEDGRAAAALAALARPVTAAELQSSVRGLPANSVDALRSLLHATGFLHPADDRSRAAAAELPAGWSFHELLAHDGSRAGLRDRQYGPVYPLRDTEPPPPPVAPARPGRTVRLHRPDLGRVAREDRSFTDVLENRASRRAYGEHPLSLAELGAYLYRAARVRTLLDARPEEGRHYAVTGRPYPSAGSAHELELYLAVHRCDGLDRGLYHYDPLGHALTALPGGPGTVDRLLHESAAATGGAPPPDVHLTVVSRIKRLSWKYAAHAYALTLKNSGVLLQTLYLVGTAMGLSVCALGGGDSDTPVHAFGLDPYDEIPVGAFLIGSAPTAP
ncbi:SagB family peptide dehydrogenase [Streptomyces libani]|uniref:SagB/ThcOx family dehydrogenase n=1 Tax=Streptomyces nigrescens TaxID=1920 RepID=UPI003063F410